MSNLAKKKWFVPLIIITLAAIAVSSLFEKDNGINSEVQSTEQKLEEMCNLVKGVSNARVMITYEKQAIEAFGYDKGEEKISGIAIACNGGEDPSVKLALYELVDALFNIKSTRISVSQRN
ncbi:MAG: hypothetical protein IKU61_05530 [Clostridia bacterium]|nr:hypothetical protein [Clostridia bacterium]